MTPSAIINSGAGLKENQDVNIQDIENNNKFLGGKLFKFKKTIPINNQRKFGDSISHPFSQLINLEPSQTTVGETEQMMHRKIPTQPYKVLDAPNLSDDFYLNLVDWSQTNILAVALGSAVYIWNACTSSVSQLCDLGDDNQVTSVAWS